MNAVGLMPKSEHGNKNDRTIQGVNGLRAIAIMMVVGYHLFPSVFPGGFLGVNVFLMLSGLLCAVTSLQRYKQKSFRPVSFYGKRILRIFPPLLLTIALVSIMAKLIAPHVLNGIVSEVVSIIFGFNNWWQIAQNSSYFIDLSSASPLIHLWYLAIEMQFYLVWPLLFKVVNTLRAHKLRGELIFLVLAIISIGLSIVYYDPTMDPSRVYYGSDTRMYAICIGAFIGYSYVYPRHEKLNDPIPLMIMMIIGSIMIIIGSLRVSPLDPFTYYLILPASAIVIAIVLTIAIDRRYVFGRWLDQPLLQWLSHHSYSLYLLHYPIYYFVTISIGKTIGWLTPWLTIVIMIIFSLWFDRFTQSIRSWFHHYTTIKKDPLFWIMSLVNGMAIIIAGVIIISSPLSRLSDDQLRLQQELEANAQKLKEQQATMFPQNSLDPNTPPESTVVGTMVPSVPSIASTVPVVSAIGDSVMLGTVDALQAIFPSIYIDAAISRQVWDGDEIIESLKAQGLLGEKVIIALGANGKFTKDVGQDLLDTIGLADHTVYWVLPYGDTIDYQAEVVDMVYQLQYDNPSLVVIDWPLIAHDHPEWFYDDNTHLNADGQQGYAQYLYDCLFNEQ